MPTKKKTPMDFAPYKSFRQKMSGVTPTKADWERYVRDFPGNAKNKKKRASSSRALVVYKPKSQTAIMNIYKKAQDKKKKGMKMVNDAEKEIAKIKFAITKFDLDSDHPGRRVTTKCVRQCLREGENYGLDLTKSYGISVRPSGRWNKQGTRYTSGETRGGKGLINLSMTERSAYTKSSTRMKKAKQNPGLRAWTDKLKKVRRSGNRTFVYKGQAYHMRKGIPRKGLGR